MAEKISPELKAELERLRLTAIPQKIRIIVELKTLPTPQTTSQTQRVFSVDFEAKIVYQSRVAPFISMLVDYDKVQQIANLLWVKKVWHVPEVQLAEVAPMAGASVTLMDSAKHIGVDVVKAAGFKGKGVLIGVTDTGCELTHPMLEGQVVAAKNFTPDVPPDDVVDVVGHGTWVASCLAGKYWVSPTGDVLEGMAPDAKLIVAKCFHAAGTTYDIVMAGVEWVCQQGAKIVSNSWGSVDPYDPLKALIISLKATYGAIFVFAGGNNGPAYYTVLFPGGYGEVLCVGSIAVQSPRVNAIADFSARGPSLTGLIKPDIMAPGGTRNPDGEELVSAAGLNNSVSGRRGTSMATPHVAGGLALLLEARVNDPVGKLCNAALDLCDLGKDNESGCGTADFAKVLGLVAADSHLLEVQTTLIGVQIYVNGGIHTTPWSEKLRHGTYLVIAPKQVFVGDKVYEFSSWENGETSTSRTINLTDDTVLKVLYKRLTAFVIYVSENSRVVEGDPNVHLRDPILTIAAQAGIAMRSFLKFDLSKLPANLVINGGKLYLRCYEQDARRTIEVYGVGDGWSENTITWNNKPPLGNFLSGKYIDSKDKIYEWDITPFAKSEYSGDKILSVCIKDAVEIAPSGYYFSTYFEGKDYPLPPKGGKSKPYLIITYEAKEHNLTVDSLPIKNIPITIDGILIGNTPMPIAVTEGEHVISVLQEVET